MRPFDGKERRATREREQSASLLLLLLRERSPTLCIGTERREARVVFSHGGGLELIRVRRGMRGEKESKVKKSQVQKSNCKLALASNSFFFGFYSVFNIVEFSI